TTLPSLTVPAGPGATIKFEISGTGCGSGAVKKTGNVSVALSDLGQQITFATPSSGAADDTVCTYTLTVSNSSTTATATGTLHVVPAPVLAGGSVILTPGAITGGAGTAVAVSLPALTSPVTSAATVTLSSSNCGGAVTKSGGAGFTAADL